MTPMRSASALLLVTAMACKTPSSGAEGGPSASASASVAPLADRAEPLRRILLAEHARRSGAIADDDLAHRDVVVRRAVARALARIGGEEARVALLSMIADDDPTVVTFAAYGVGQNCALGDRDATVDALTARMATLDRSPVALGADGLEHPLVASARAIGQCGTERGEQILAGFLFGGEVETDAAILGLGSLAVTKKRLREETIASLLNAAAGTAAAPPRPMALFPLARVDNVPPSVIGRLTEVARTRLDEASPYRIFAVRALERAKEAAVPGLERVLTAPEFNPPERVEAVRALRRIGKAGDEILAKHLDASFPTQAEIEAGDPRYVVFVAMLDALVDTSKVHAVLERATKLATPDTDAKKRRVAQVACKAAALLTPADAAAPGLARCDSGGLASELAILSLLEKGARGPKALVEKLLASPHARVREGALKLVYARDDLDAIAIFAAALTAEPTGVVIAAAEELALHPELAGARKKRPAAKKADKSDKADKPSKPKDDARSEPAPPPDKRVVTALEAALTRAKTANDPELDAAVMQAAAALSLTSLDATIDATFCKSAYPADREKARDALSILRRRKVDCPAWPIDDPRWKQPIESLVVPEALRIATGKPRVVFETDAGELTFLLDLEAAPVAGTRLLELVRAGYYDGNVIHRVDPAFVVQFGSPDADGSGGPPDRLPMRCETSPRPFERMSVGVALSGRDTGSSQFFVTLGRSPHLDGRYAWIGTATGPWDRVVEGDPILKARVVE